MRYIRRLYIFVSVGLLLLLISFLPKSEDSEPLETRRAAWNSRKLARGEPSGVGTTPQTYEPSAYHEVSANVNTSFDHHGSDLVIDQPVLLPVKTDPDDRAARDEAADRRHKLQRIGKMIANSRHLRIALDKAKLAGKTDVKHVKISVTPSSVPYKNELKEIYNEKLDEYKRRKLLVSEVCKRYRLGKFYQQFRPDDSLSAEQLNDGRRFRGMESDFSEDPSTSLMWDSNWHLLYCWIHKVASSSWGQIFYNLDGKEVPSLRLHEAAFDFAPKPTDLPVATANSLVFTFVRHPFERLVSAYRDKFEFAKNSAYVYSNYAWKVLGIHQSELNKYKHPTFLQFVNYLLRTPVKDYNDHWRPYWLHCHFCQMEYDVFAKMETFATDIKFITGVTGLSTTNLTLPWNNRHNSTGDLAVQYFRSLAPDTVISLYNIYRIDFEMFNYSIDPYLAEQDDP